MLGHLGHLAPWLFGCLEQIENFAHCGDFHYTLDFVT